MRTFTLYDADGNTYDLTAKGELFFYGIENLGYQTEAKFQRIEDRFAILENYMAQAKIKGTIRFWQPNAEFKYFEFSQFCQNKPLRMEYNPGHGLFSRDGYITQVKRSDGKDKALTIEIEFSATTPWYKVVAEYNTGDVTDGKTYNYTYDYHYSSAVQGSVIIDSDSFQSSPVKLIILGPVTNPTWRHYLNNVLQTEGKVNGEVLANNRLIIDTTTIPYSIKQVDAYGNLVADMYQQSDFSMDRFVRFGYGRNVVSVTAENVDVVKLGVEAQIEYATV